MIIAFTHRLSCVSLKVTKLNKAYCIHADLVTSNVYTSDAQNMLIYVRMAIIVNCDNKLYCVKRLKFENNSLITHLYCTVYRYIMIIVRHVNHALLHL